MSICVYVTVYMWVSMHVCSYVYVHSYCRAQGELCGLLAGFPTLKASQLASLTQGIREPVLGQARAFSPG